MQEGRKMYLENILVTNKVSYNTVLYINISINPIKDKSQSSECCIILISIYINAAARR